MAEHDASIRCADRASSFDIFLLPHRKDLSAREASLCLPTRETNADHDKKQATKFGIQLTKIVSERTLRRLGKCGTEESHEQDNKEQTREGIQHIHDAHHDVINATAEETRDASI